MSEQPPQLTFEQGAAIARMRAHTDYKCVCKWCCYRAYQVLSDKPDPGRPTQAVAAEVLHQGPAQLELVR